MWLCYHVDMFSYLTLCRNGLKYKKFARLAKMEYEKMNKNRINFYKAKDVIRRRKYYKFSKFGKN